MIKETNLPRDSKGKLDSYAWPGGYPLFYVTRDNMVICPDCANKEGMNEDQEPIACDVNWEDDSLYCEDCGKRIASAYAEED
jgi:hypothetical protein